MASRYPDGSYLKMRDALAQIHGVQRDNIMLGCGSTEILCVADEAFLGPGKNLVVADTTFEAVIEYVRLRMAKSIKVPMTPDHRPRSGANGRSVHIKDRPRLHLQPE